MKNTLKFKEKEIDKKSSDTLRLIGFNKKRKGIYTKSINDDVNILLIIEKTDRRTGNTFYLNPIVGIVDSRVERLYQELVSDIDTSNAIINTATVSLGYLTPEKKYVAWTIPMYYDEAQTQEVVDDLVSSLKAYAIPFMDTLKERGKLLDALKNNKIGLQKSNYFRVPILYYLCDLKDKGVEYVRNILRDEKPTPKNIAIQEPEFSTYKEALDYFRQDKDVRFYYSYKNFASNFVNI